MFSPTGPILVTGVPRSGTTWLARLFAAAPGTSLAGREPMNPRGKQYALGGTLSEWTRLTRPSGRQALLLRTTYAGLNPRTYGRYGRHQTRAMLPGTRMIVKDPFAMLSVPAIYRLTGARAVLVYRHPGAVLASYRRMGWSADIAETFRVATDHAEEVLPLIGSSAGDLLERGPDALTDTEAMGLFWTVFSALATDDVKRTPGALIVAHPEVAAGGTAAVDRLMTAVGLRATDAVHAEISAAGAGDAPTPRGEAPDSGKLHRFDRSPAEVANSWRKHVDATDIERLEEIAGPVLATIEAARLKVLDG
ncbi:MAG: sulfotransferase [Nocardioides sp.]